MSVGRLALRLAHIHQRKPDGIGLRNMQQLADTDPMPFGKHKGKPMSEVPASYLHWLWTENRNSSQAVSGSAVLQYIQDNIMALKKEYPDGIW